MPPAQYLDPAPKLLRLRQLDFLAYPNMLHAHTAFELARYDSQESDTIPVSRIHIGLNLKYVSGELLICGFHHTLRTAARLRLRRKLKKVLQEGLDAEIVDRTAEEYRR